MSCMMLGREASKRKSEMEQCH